MYLLASLVYYLAHLAHQPKAMRQWINQIFHCSLFKQVLLSKKTKMNTDQKSCFFAPRTRIR